MSILLQLSVLMCFVILFNVATPQTRRDSVVEQLSSQGQGLAIVVFVYAFAWAFAWPAYMRCSSFQVRFALCPNAFFPQVS